MYDSKLQWLFKSCAHLLLVTIITMLVVYACMVSQGEQQKILETTYVSVYQREPVLLGQHCLVFLWDSEWCVRGHHFWDMRCWEAQRFFICFGPDGWTQSFAYDLETNYVSVYGDNRWDISSICKYTRGCLKCLFPNNNNSCETWHHWNELRIVRFTHTYTYNLYKCGEE